MDPRRRDQEDDEEWHRDDPGDREADGQVHADTLCTSASHYREPMTTLSTFGRYTGTTVLVSSIKQAATSRPRLATSGDGPTRDPPPAGPRPCRSGRPAARRDARRR